MGKKNYTRKRRKYKMGGAGQGEVPPLSPLPEIDYDDLISTLDIIDDIDLEGMMGPVSTYSDPVSPPLDDYTDPFSPILSRQFAREILGPDDNPDELESIREAARLAVSRPRRNIIRSRPIRSLIRSRPG